MRTILKVLIISAVLTVAGCTSSVEQSYVYDNETKEPTSGMIAQKDIEQVMNTARKQLSAMGFKLDKYDTELGILRTKPLSGAQYWQFWRDDNVGASNAAMSNINSIVRIVEMDFNASDGGIKVGCVADVKKLSYIGKEITGVSDMNEAFTDVSGGFQELALEEGQAKWLDLGRDVRLEKKVLRLITDNR
ncbi:MAG: hypothetical protein ACIAQZ_08650 [Sedimentisphaeraceae bacterium JB056]